MRLFIAIELPDAIKQAIARVQDQLKSSGASANWTRPEGIHLTLKFLGEVEEARVPDIMQLLDNAAQGIGKLVLEIAGAGAFPNVKAPRVFWIGVTGDIERLSVLQGRVEDAMAGLGFAREARKFSPHLTLARIRFPKQRDNWQKTIESIRDVQLGRFEAGHISVIKSELRRDGAVYTEIAKVDLVKREE